MATFSFSPQWKYDVFLSFRGKDTRKNFVDHLYEALHRKGIHTFKDDEKLERGKSLSPELFKAIESSRFCIVVISKNYASSSWCLNELVMIMDRCKTKSTTGQTVLPVFYDVDPSEVRKHELVCFKDQSSLEKVERWKEALVEVANISGWDLRNTSNGMEAKVIQEIIGHIFKLSHETVSSVFEDLVGIEARLAQVISVLGLDGEDRNEGIHIIGICGMGGIGKTTIAKAVFDQISSQFEGCCYLANVRERSKKHGLECLREQLLSEILMESDLKIRDFGGGLTWTRKRLRHIRVLIVLDDVDWIGQLESLIGKRDWLGAGSRVIITTRDEHLLTTFEVNHIYKVQKLRNEEGFKLFCHKAFRNNQPPKEFLGLINCVLLHADGLPLALKVLGSFLFGRNIVVWESALDRLKESLNKELFEILKISYDGLEYTEKKIFLDIACFFKGESKDYVGNVLDGCGYHADIGLSVLVERSLVTIVKNELIMHDLIQEMGWQIVREESPEEPGKRSRLWRHQDIYEVLRKNKGTEAVEGIILGPQGTKKLCFNADSFSKLNRLRLLKISNVMLPCGLEYLSNELRLLHWHGYPLKYLPTGFLPESLVVLNMCYSRIERLWEGLEGVQHLDQLKFIDLSHSANLTKTPDFTWVPNLEKLVLGGCTGLVEIHPSIGLIKRLICLNLEGCKYLKILPTSKRFESLHILVLSGCSKLKNISEVLGNLRSLSELYLDGTGIAQLPLSVGYLSNLVLVSMRNCKNLASLPHSVSRLSNLKTLNLSGCSKLDMFPELLEDSSLQELHADGTAIRQPPSSIVLLKKLQVLSFGCKETECKPWTSYFSSLLNPRRSPNPLSLVLPPLSGLWFLKELDLSDCNLIEDSIPGDLGCMSSLEQLNLSRNNFISIPDSISQLSRLFNIELEGCSKLEALPELPTGIALINAHNCTSLERISSPLTRYKALWEFRFSNCHKLANNQQSYNNLAATFLHTQFQEPSVSTRDFNTIFISGSEMPVWFKHKNNMGRSIRIELPPDWWNKLVGFVVCAIFAAVGKTRASANVRCYWGHFKDSAVYGIDAPICYFTTTTSEIVDSNHVCLSFIPMEWLPFSCDSDMDPRNFTQFEVLFRSYYPTTFVPIKCGVHLVYKLDAEQMDETGGMIQNTGYGHENFEGTNRRVLKRSLEERHNNEDEKASGSAFGDEDQNMKRTRGSNINQLDPN